MGRRDLGKRTHQDGQATRRLRQPLDSGAAGLKTGFRFAISTGDTGHSLIPILKRCFFEPSQTTAYLFVAAFGAALAGVPPADGHGFSGDRFFPATLTIDDPFVADELSLPTFTGIRQPGSPPAKTYDFSTDLSLVVLPHLGISIGDGYQIQKIAGQKGETGFDNIDYTIQYELGKIPAHEFVASVGLVGEIGGTGSRAIGVDRFNTFTPTFYFGKGFGDLPNTLSFIRPAAVTGTVGLAFPSTANAITADGKDYHQNSVSWGLALEYSVIYLQSHVKDIGLRAPFDRMIPLVEFAFDSPYNRRHGGPTTGSINPGVIWSGQYFQIGVEAIIPVNQHTGNNLGVLAQLHFYLDDVLPAIFSHPLINP
jgi:hypothetical protein